MSTSHSLFASLRVIASHVAYLAVVAALVLLIPPTTIEELGRIGGSGARRHRHVALRLGPDSISCVRHLQVSRLSAHAAEAEAFAAAEGRRQHAYFLVTSFRIGTETTATVYKAALEAALAYARQVDDHRLDRRDGRPAARQVAVPLARRRRERAHQPSPGADRRDGQARRLGVTASGPSPDCMPDDDDIVVVIDGDSIVPPDLIERCGPLLFAQPTRRRPDDRRAVARFDGAGIFRNWYALRFAQRHILMSSLALSRARADVDRTHVDVPRAASPAIRTSSARSSSTTSIIGGSAGSAS